MVLASLVGIVGVALARTDMHAQPAARRGVFVPERPHEPAALHAGGRVVDCELAVAAGRLAGPAHVRVSVGARSAQRDAGVAGCLAEVCPLSRAVDHAGLAAVVRELQARAAQHASPGEVVRVEVGLGGALGHAAVGGVVGEEAELPAGRHAGAISRVGVAARRTSPDAVACGGVAELVRVGGTGLDAHLGVVVAELGKGRVALGHALEEMRVGP